MMLRQDTNERAVFIIATSIGANPRRLRLSCGKGLAIPEQPDALVLQPHIHHRHSVFGRGVSIVRGRVAKNDIVRFHAAVRRLTAVAVAATPDYS